MHAALVSDGYQSAMLLQVYKKIAASYCANKLIIDTDEDVLTFELQKFLNSAIALLLIDSDKKVFTRTLYLQLDTYLTTEDKDTVLAKLDEAIEVLTQQLPLLSREYLQEVGLLDFNELKGIIKEQVNLSVYIPEILELPISVANELNEDFEGGYDFHADDEDDIAYLKPDET